jgi:hypothetical protein
MAEPARDQAGSAPAGIVYSAFGERYIAEAVRAARSSLAHNDVPHVIFAAGEVADPPPGVRIERFEQTSTAPFLDRIANMRRSPFERTIYLDTDTFVAGEIVHLLDVLDNYDLAVAQAPAYRGLDDPEVPAAFPEFNCGVVAWRASERVAEFLRSWEETYREWLEKDVLTGRHGGDHPSRTVIGDQPAFRRCAWQHEMRVATLPPEYNLRIGVPATVIGPVRVLHGHTDRPEAYAERYNRTLGPRSFPAPEPVRGPARRLYRRLRRLA